MATATQLGKIGALVERIAALDNKQRGMRIEADEWNDLVAVVRGLLDIEKTQESSLESELEEVFALKGHQHVGEIGLEDLDTDLRSRVGADGGGISTRQAIVDIQKKLDSIASEAARVTTVTEQLQRDLDRSSADDLDRSAKLRRFEERFTGLENLRGLVSGLSGQVDGLKDGIDAVLELRGSLGGVDVAALGNRVGDLEALGKNQLGVDGHPLPVKQLELAVKELQDVLEVGGNAGGLEERFNGLKAELTGALDDRVDSGLASAQAALDGKLQETRGALTAEIGTQVGAARGELETLVDARVAGVRDGLDASLSGKLETATADLRTAVTAETTAMVDARLSTLPTQVRDAANAAVAAARPGLLDELGATVASAVDGRVTPLGAELSARADALDKRFDERDGQMPELVRTVATDLLPQLVDARVAQASDALGSTLGARIDQQLVQARDAILSSVQSQLPTIARDIIGDLDGRIRQQVDGRLSDLDTRIASAAADAVGDLTGRIDEMVRGQIAQLGLDQRFSDVLSKAVAEIDARLEKTRAEFFDVVKSSMADALTQARAELARMRDSITADFEGALEKSQTTLKQQVDRALAGQWSKTEGIVADLRNAVTPRLDRLERKVFPNGPTGVIGTNIGATVVNPPPGG